MDLPGGSFRMGSTSFYPEEAPVHTVTVASFAVERHPVTNAQFAEFVAATGYVTVAEQPIDPALYPGIDPADLRAGALVFRATPGPVDLRDWRQWWSWVPGANWRRPFGPDSDIADRGDHPVVQVAYPDAVAYARWAGRRLPTEAEWEYAARGGSAAAYSWGDEVKPDGRLMANTWQGRFPYRNDGALGWVGTSPVGDVSAERVRPARHDRQRLGVDRHRVLGAPPARPAAESLLHAIRPRRSDRQPGLEGRFAPVRPGVLPSLPSGSAVTAITGHCHHSHRVSVRVGLATRRRIQLTVLVGAGACVNAAWPVGDESPPTWDFAGLWYPVLATI